MMALPARVIQDRQASNFNAVSVATLLAYEMLITLGREIDYIWQSRWTPVKVVYLAIRYYAMSFTFMNSFVVTTTGWSPHFCRNYQGFQLWSAGVTLPLVDIIITLRIYALYGASKTMGFALASLLISQTIICFTLLGLATRTISTESIVDQLPENLAGCIATPGPRFQMHTLIFWSTFSAFQAIYVMITFFKFYIYFREFGYSRLVVTPLLNVFFRDGALYFVIILGVVLVNTLIEKLDSPDLGMTAAYWAPAIASIMACRLMLNIRHITAPSRVLIRSHEFGTELNDMRFRGRPNEIVSRKQQSVW